MNVIYYMYQCRLCGEVFPAYTAEWCDTLADTERELNRSQRPDTILVSIPPYHSFYVHHCDDTRVGIGDFAGFQEFKREHDTD